MAEEKEPEVIEVDLTEDEENEDWIRAERRRKAKEESEKEE